MTILPCRLDLGKLRHVEGPIASLLIRDGLFGRADALMMQIFK